MKLPYQEKNYIKRWYPFTYFFIKSIDAFLLIVVFILILGVAVLSIPGYITRNPVAILINIAINSAIAYFLFYAVKIFYYLKIEKILCSIRTEMHLRNTLNKDKGNNNDLPKPPPIINQ